MTRMALCLFLCAFFFFACDDGGSSEDGDKQNLDGDVQADGDMEDTACQGECSSVYDTAFCLSDANACVCHAGYWEIKRCENYCASIGKDGGLCRDNGTTEFCVCQETADGDGIESEILDDDVTELDGNENGDDEEQPLPDGDGVASDGDEEGTDGDQIDNDATDGDISPDGDGEEGDADEKPIEISWCRLQWPDSVEAETGAIVRVWGRVDVQGITDRTRHTDMDARLLAQAGFGADGSVPGAQWTWTAAAANTEWNDGPAGEPGHDEYKASLSATHQGEFDFAFRFSVDDGKNWMYCDRDMGAGKDGSENGYQTENSGSMIVKETVDGDQMPTDGDSVDGDKADGDQTVTDGDAPADGDTEPEPEIDWCRLQWPLDLTIDAGVEFDVYGRVHSLGITTKTHGNDPDVRLKAQSGYGPDGSDPASGTWVWREASVTTSWNDQTTNEVGNDEYRAVFSVSNVGNYDLAFRFSADGGVTWTYCDKATGYQHDGSEDGYQSANAGSLKSQVPMAQWCRLQWPLEKTVLSGAEFSVYGRVFEPGLTDLTNEVDSDARLIAQVGYGPTNGAPQTDDIWTWGAAAGNPDWDASENNEIGNDEYVGKLKVSVVGTYHYAFRFSMDQGAHWLYCDRGAGYGHDGSEDGFQQDKAGTLTVRDKNPVKWCRLQWPLETTVSPGTSVTVFGRVNEPGITDKSDATDIDALLLGQAGFGPDGSNPDGSAEWQWTNANPNGTWNAQAANEPGNDEYQANLTAPSAGLYDIAVRFSADGGLSWTYCDKSNGFEHDGSEDGYQAENSGSLHSQ